MDDQGASPSSVLAMPVSTATQTRPEGPAHGSVSPSGPSPSPRDSHDQMAARMNDIVIRRIFAAGLDLQAALGLIGDHRAAGKIGHASDELDRAIRDLRDILFEGRP